MSATKRVLAIQFTIGVSLALLIAAITLLIRVETPRQILEEVLHRPVEIQYRMAVLAARRGAYEESISLFQQVLQRSHGREDVLADYFFCLSWARRYKDLLDVYGQLPPSLRAQKEYLLAATIATLALKDYGRVSKLIGQSARAADDPVLALLALPNEMRRILGPNSEPIAGRLLETESAHYRAFAAQRQAAIRSRQGDLKAALSLIEQACSEPDVASEALFDRVVILSWADRHAEAIARYRVLPDLGDRPTFLLEAAARSYREMGRRDLALDLYRQILRREPGHDRALDAALGLLLDADRFEEARALLGDHEPATRSSSAWPGRIAHFAARMSHCDSMWISFEVVHCLGFAGAMAGQRNDHGATDFPSQRKL